MQSDAFSLSGHVISQFELFSCQ